MDAQWSDDFHHALFAVLTGHARRVLPGFWRAGPVGQGAGAHLCLRRHLFRAIAAAFMAGLRTSSRSTAFFGYIQTTTKSAIGRWATASAILPELDRARIAAAVVLLSPFVPMLFQGEEWACFVALPVFCRSRSRSWPDWFPKAAREEFAAFGWDPDSIPDPRMPRNLSALEAQLGRSGEAGACGNAGVVSRADSLAQTTFPRLNNGEPGNVRVTFDEKKIGCAWSAARSSCAAI